MMSKPVVLVGQAPSARSEVPFGGRSGRRLADLCGVAHDEFLLLFERRNILDAFPGKDGRGDAFPPAQARRLAQAMIPALVGRRVILVGAATAIAFGVRRVELFDWAPRFGATVAVCPHPSGVNRWWNPPENAAMAEAFWRALVALV